MGFFDTYKPSLAKAGEFVNRYYNNVLSDYAVYKDAVVYIDMNDLDMKFVFGDSVAITKLIRNSDNITLFTKTDYDEGHEYIKKVSIYEK